MPRIVEVIIALGLLLLFALPMILLAAMIYAVDGKPIIYAQGRVGYEGRIFNILKFRSLTNARDISGTLLPDAQRYMPLTRLLRRSRLDELPQLWLILLGDLALVGPRPLLPETIRSFGDLGFERCQVRPGMTGWAQVSGNTKLSDREKLMLDLWYAAHRSLALDVRILIDTVRVVAFGETYRGDRVEAARAWMQSAGLPDLPPSVLAT